MNSAMPVSALLWFVAIVVMIPLALWLLKRTPLGGAASTAGMRSISALALSNTQRLLTVEVGQGDQRRWLVLGVTPQAISILHTMDAAGSAAPSGGAALPAASGNSFAQMLGRLRGNPTGADGAP